MDRISPLPGCIIDGEERLTTEHFAEIVDRLDLYERIRQVLSVVIKPNLAGGSLVAADSHIITDLRLIKEVIGGIKAINPACKIFIAESDSTGNGYAFRKFKHLGLDKWNIENVFILDLSRDILQKVDMRRAKYFKIHDRQLWLSETWLSAGMIVSMANLKTHSVTKFSGTCKNLFGLLPSPNKEVYHPYVDKVIHDLVKATPPQLNILDGYFAMDENGPMIGRPINLKCRVFSTSPVIADIVGCKMIRLKFRRVKHLAYLAPSDMVGRDFECPVYDIAYPGRWLRFFNAVGLFIQKIGYAVYQYGHRIHDAKSPFYFAYMSARPLLLTFFELETLKRWKRKLMK